MIEIEELETIEPLINYRKIKYKDLTEMINNSSMEGDNINLFINLDTILKNFYKDNIIAEMHSLQSLDNIILTAELINIIAHYRHFFYSRYRSKTKFYFYKYNKSITYKFNDNYMSNYDKFIDTKNSKIGVMNKLIKNNLKLVDIISTYICDAYYIDSNGIDPSLIPYYIITNETNNEKYCNLIITDDKSEYQLTNLPNTFILRALGSRSKLIANDNILDYKLDKLKYRPINNISTELYPLILSIIGNKDRNIKHVDGFTFTATMKMIDKLLTNNIIKNKNQNNLDYAAFQDYMEPEQFIMMENNYKTINLHNTYKVLTKLDKYRIQKKIINRYDNLAIMDINSRYFPNNNIQLIELCEGVDM